MMSPVAMPFVGFMHVHANVNEKGFLKFIKQFL